MNSQEKLIALVQKRYTGDVSGFIDASEGKNTAEKKQKSSNSEENKQILSAEKEYKEALAFVKDAISPAFLKVQQDKIRINNTFAKTFFVYSYPNFLEGNWLSPVINWDVKFDMSLYIYPIDSAFVQKYLRKRLTQLHSERSINAEK